jgi:transcriptional regulator with XRE-family HTH domain
MFHLKRFSSETKGFMLPFVPKQTVTERVKEAMQERGMNQNQLKERGGFKDGYLSNLFKRNSDGLHPKTIARLAEALEVRYDWLARGEGPRDLPKPPASEQPASDTQPRKVNDESPELPAVTSLVVRDEVSLEGLKFLGEHPAYPEAEAEARRLCNDEMPNYIWQDVRQSGGMRIPSELTGYVVLQFARAWLTATTETERIRRARAETRAEMAAYFAEQERKKKAAPEGELMLHRCNPFEGPDEPEEPADGLLWVPPPVPSGVRWTLREYLRLLMQGKWSMVGERPPKLTYVDRREYAERFYRKSKLPIGCNPLWILEWLDCDYAPADIDGETRELYRLNKATDRGCVLFSLRGGPRRWGVRVSHGGSHWINDKDWCGTLEHTDIWLGGLELSMPTDWMLDVGLERALRELTFQPEWLVRDYWEAITGQMGGKLRWAR